MQNNRFLNLFMVFALIFTFSVMPDVFAQTTGKIAGTVTDSQTGEALPGANIQIEGTTMGAASDINGEYSILHVPVGTYKLVTSFIGYREYRIANVKVHVGLTTELNFELTPEAIEASTVTIIAEKPLIQKNATNAVRIVTSEELENLPIRGVDMVANLQPGMVAQDGNIYIRGGREDEVGTYVEGANIRSVVTGDAPTMVIPEAMEELQIQAGGFNAQYGGANSGIVSYVMKSGTPDYHMSLRAETDNFTDMNEKFLDTYSYGYSNAVLTASGPVPFLGKNVKFFVAGENRFDRDYYKKFWTPFEIQHGDPMEGVPGETWELIDSGVDASGAAGDSVEAIVWGGGNAPHAMRNRYTGNGVLTFDFYPITVRLSGSFTWQKRQMNNAPLRHLFNRRRIPVRDYSDGLVSGKITHVLSPKTFYTVGFNYFDQRRKQYDPIFGDNYWIYADSLQNANEGLPGFLTFTNDPDHHNFYGFRFDAPGNILANYSKYKRNYMGAHLDFTHQLKDHMIQFGGSFQYWTLRNFSSLGGINTGTILNFLRSDPDILNDQERLDLFFRSRNPNNYGYDYLGNETDEGTLFDTPKHPLEMAIYIQDKFEIRDLVINAGLRFDYYEMDQYEPESYEEPGFDQGDLLLPEGDYFKTDPFSHVSPRLGFAFPVTDRTVFHLQWGKFIQMPEMSRVYRSNSERAAQYGAGFFYTNPMGFGIRPERTTQYEIGFSQQLGANASFDATLFYKDIKNQLQTMRTFTSAATTVQAYDIHTNGDFATTKGLEFRFILRRTNRIQGFLNYTFSQAKGTGSYSTQNNASLDQNTNQILIITPLYYNQTHRGSINLDYRFAEDDGGPILERTGLNLMFTFNSGHPYTLSGGGLGQIHTDQGALLEDIDARNRRPLEAVGSSTTPWVFNLDAKLDKTVTVGPLDLNFYVYVQNLLNTKNVLNVHQRTGSAEDDGFLTNPDFSQNTIDSYGPGYVLLYEYMNLENRNHWDNQINAAGEGSQWGTDLWGTPRQIRAGVNIMF